MWYKNLLVSQKDAIQRRFTVPWTSKVQEIQS